MNRLTKFLLATSSPPRPFSHARRFPAQVAVAILAVLATGAITPARVAKAADGTATVDDNAATNGGSITVTVKYNKAGVPTTVAVPVTVAKGDDSKTIRNSINAALSTNATLKADFTFATNSKAFGEYQLVKLTKIVATTTVTDVDINNTGVIKGPTFGGGSQASLNFRDFFRVTGTVATANDAISIEIDRASDVNWTSPDIFQLASSAGLSPMQIASDLAALIDANPIYDAVQVGNEVFISGDINTDFGTHMLLGPEDVNITGAAGVQAMPEPGTLGLLVGGLVGLFIFSKRLVPKPPEGA